ncbi:hypothetical protein [Nocardia sp. NRRL S-836]|uniref:hypothetical protein n=1 Tax=Nocardia sp. NRRL S-836 TaxID=1519492 RepID=UPI0012FB8324|nr:hypothetical protein [Nocardia sp. NRRL S-836]
MTVRVGPAGGLRTLQSARLCWRNLRYFLHFLARHLAVPHTPEQLRAQHLHDFVADRTCRARPAYGLVDVEHVVQVLRCPPLHGAIEPAVLQAAPTRTAVSVRPRSPQPGYSDGELHRLLVAAREHVNVVRARIEDSERLLATDPVELDE